MRPSTAQRRSCAKLSIRLPYLAAHRLDQNSRASGRQAARGIYRTQEPLWRVKAREEGRLRTHRPPDKRGAAVMRSRDDAATAWRRIAMTLENSESRDDQLLARQIAEFVKNPSQIRKVSGPLREHERPVARNERPEPQRAQTPGPEHSRGPEIRR